MEYSNETHIPALISENNIRNFQSELQSVIDDFEKHDLEPTYLQTFNLCDNVKHKILNYEDEPQLSRVQNNLRRICIASELIVGICSIHDHIVDFAFTKIINDLLLLDKYKIISSKIAQKRSSNLKKEKYFAKEAHIKLLRSLKDDESPNVEEEKEIRRTEPAPEEKGETEKQLENLPARTQEEISLNEIENILSEDLLIDSCQLNVMGDMTEVRIEPQLEASNLIVPTRTKPDDITLHPPEISIREPFDQQPVEEDINQILQTCDKIPQPNLRKSVLSESLLEPVGNILEIEGPQVEKSLTPTKSIESQIQQEEDAEEWSLSTLEPVEIPKKKYLKTDKLTVIPDYSIRAKQLNKNIEIQRVQVFEGPPTILQSMSSEYLMKTSGFKRFLSQNVRSSMLNMLYKRNLTTEKRPAESFIMPKIQTSAVEPKLAETELELQEIPHVEQEVGKKVGMQSEPVESVVLAELVDEKTHPSISVNEPCERDVLMGLPTSRIASPVIQAPDKEKINSALPMPTPRIQQLQGTILEPRKRSPPWFFSAKEKPPRAEFREFNYVRNKLHTYWSLFETHGMEKSITMREFLLFEEDGNVANYLTLLRIVDKLSIQRKLFLDFKNGDILIKPFETPCISKDQLLLQGKEQIF